MAYANWWKSFFFFFFHLFQYVSMFGLNCDSETVFIIFIWPYKLPLENKARSRERYFSLWFLPTAEHNSEPSATTLSSFMEFFLVLTDWCLHSLSEWINKCTVHIWPLTRTRRLYFKLIQWQTSMMNKPQTVSVKEFIFKINKKQTKNKKEKGMKFKGRSSSIK